MKDGGNYYYFPGILKNLGAFSPKFPREKIFPRNDLVEGQNFSDTLKLLRGGRVIGGSQLVPVCCAINLPFICVKLRLEQKMRSCENLNTRKKFSRSFIDS